MLLPSESDPPPPPYLNTPSYPFSLSVKRKKKKDWFTGVQTKQTVQRWQCSILGSHDMRTSRAVVFFISAYIVWFLCIIYKWFIDLHYVLHFLAVVLGWLKRKRLQVIIHSAILILNLDRTSAHAHHAPVHYQSFQPHPPTPPPATPIPSHHTAPTPRHS